MKTELHIILVGIFVLKKKVFYCKHILENCDATNIDRQRGSKADKEKKYIFLKKDSLHPTGAQPADLLERKQTFF